MHRNSNILKKIKLNKKTGEQTKKKMKPTFKWFSREIVNVLNYKVEINFFFFFVEL